MKYGMALTVFTFLSVVAAGATAQQVFQIPPKYWGEYNTNLAHCGSGLNDTRLRIALDTMHFYESEATIQGAITQPNGDLTLLLEFSGEGQIWSNMLQLSLSKDGQILTITHPRSAQGDQSTFARKRCP